MPRRITIHEEDYARLLEMNKADAGLVLQNLIRTLNGEPVEIKGDAYVDYFSEVACQKMMRFVELSERQAEKGRKGGAPIGNTNRKQAENKPKTNQKQTETSPNTNTNTITNTINKYMPAISEILKYLNEKAGTHYRSSKDSSRFISGRLAEGFTVEDFRTVIDKKVKEWKGTEMAAYIRPSTLFAPSHFEEYLNQPEKKKATQFTEGATDAVYNFSDLEKRLIKN